MKILKNYGVKKHLLSAFLATASILGFWPGNTLSAYAASSSAKTEPYFFGETDSQNKDYTDDALAPAVKLLKSVDGMPAGTLLYRTQYLDMTYYSPIAPAHLQDTKHEPEANKKYRLWGPWDMVVNQTGHVDKNVSYSPLHYFTNSYTMKNVTAIGTAKFDIITEDGTIIKDWGTFKKNTVLNVRAVTKYYNDLAYVYFSLDGLDNVIKTSSSAKPDGNVGRVMLGNTTNRGDKIQISRVASDADAQFQSIYDNFILMGSYKLNVRSHEFLEPGKWVNSSGAAKYNLDGKNGEWSHIGYNADGDALINPYFPSISLHFRGCMEPKYYDWRDTPWSGTKSDEFPALTIYDKESRFDAAKRNVIKKFLELDLLSGSANSTSDINKYLNIFSFRNHPEHDLVIALGQRRGSGAKRMLTYNNEISDLYLAAIKVYDGSTLVASYEYDINTKKVTRKEGTNIIGGRDYRVEVYMGNAKNKKIIAKKNQTHLGYKVNSKAYSSLPTTLLDNVWSKEATNSIGATKGSISKAYSYIVTAPRGAQFFDIYGYVGELHWGSDNLDTTNDIGRVRMTILEDEEEDDSNNIERSEADLVAKKIELINSKKEVVYSFTRGDKKPSIKKAIVPGETYHFRYTIVNEGDDAKYRTKIPGRWEGSKWIAPTWSDWKYDKYEVSITHKHKRIVSGPNNGDDIVPSLETLTHENKYVANSNGLTRFTVKAGQEIVFESGIGLMMENPYLEIGFEINCDNALNKNKNNDSLNVIIDGIHDIVIGDVNVFPKYEFTDDGKKTVSYTISYDATLNVEDYVPKNKVYSLVETSINIGGKTIVVADLLRGGENNNISHTIDGVSVNPSDNLIATVILNYHKHTYETNYDNNRGTSDATSVRTIGNPFAGSNTDRVVKQDTSNGSTFSGGGSANNNCLVPRTKNSWSVSHREHIWSASTKSYDATDGVNRTFKQYSTTSESQVSKNYSEEFKIVNILFRSKTTIDSKSGTNKDGWVDLANAKEQDLAVIKAGYGFELKVITEYSTNVLKTQPKSIVNSNRTNGTDYNGVVGENAINYSKELFVELPGSNKKRKILSTTGYKGTTKALNVKEEDLSTSTKTIKRFTYTIKPTTTSGSENSDKIFIPERIVNGDYNISVYTAPVSGVSSPGKNRYTALCDRKDVNIKVEGSYVDDLNSNIIQ